jgi:hypothetical protein
MRVSSLVPACLVAAALAAAPIQAQAERPAGRPENPLETPPPPPLPDMGRPAAPRPPPRYRSAPNVPEGEVTIIERDQGEVQEYRSGGRLYMIRVVPNRGVPYYLVDTDGDGNLDTRMHGLSPDFLVPAWVLYSW